jgi:HSP20 family protein
MAVIRWSGHDPFRELASLQERLNRVFEESFARAPRGHDGNEELSNGTWIPPVDIFETKDRLVLKAELPGFREDQIHLRFDEGVLTLEGERKFEKETGDESYHRVERSYGRFQRSFTLPRIVDNERISASFENGILTVEMPRREETRPKQIAIQAAGATPAISVKPK